MKTLGANAKAILLYRQIKQIQRELYERLEKQGVFKKLEQDIETVLKKGKIDPETAGVLKMLLGKERPISDQEKISRAIDATMKATESQRSSIELKFIPLTLTNTGDLYKDTDDQCRYPLRDEGMRLKILRVLIGREGYYSSAELQESAESASYKSFTNAISKINSKAQNLLNLPEAMNYEIAFSY